MLLRVSLGYVYRNRIIKLCGICIFDFKQWCYIAFSIESTYFQKFACLWHYCQTNGFKSVSYCILTIVCTSLINVIIVHLLPFLISFLWDAGYHAFVKFSNKLFFYCMLVFWSSLYSQDMMALKIRLFQTISHISWLSFHFLFGALWIKVFFFFFYICLFMPF